MNPTFVSPFTRDGQPRRRARRSTETAVPAEGKKTLPLARSGQRRWGQVGCATSNFSYLGSGRSCANPCPLQHFQFSVPKSWWVSRGRYVGSGFTQVVHSSRVRRRNVKCRKRNSTAPTTSCLVAHPQWDA